MVLKTGTRSEIEKAREKHDRYYFYKAVHSLWGYVWVNNTEALWTICCWEGDPCRVHVPVPF